MTVKMSWLDGIIDSMDASWSKLQKIVKNREAQHAAVRGVTKSQHSLATEQQMLQLRPSTDKYILKN